MGNLTDDWGTCFAPPSEFTAIAIVRTPVRRVPAQDGRIIRHWAVGRRVTIVNVYFNHHGNEWWTTSCGYQVYSGNFET